ncbi:MAG TPA: matrixin family metalloprotease [Spirochaetia bacterium]|nr:matrixin family metalloprotease [Spirochaetales bacterium]HRY81003.1 matrixin family metalloprotease [Spirochaetia bacterium]HRZ90315.1 matrixin family metalloprotease [Spirochaetia bacterium]
MPILLSAILALSFSSCMPRRVRLDRDIPVYLQPGMPSGFEGAIRDCLAIWNREFGTGLRIAGYHEGGQARDGRNTISLGVAAPPSPARRRRDARLEADRLGFTVNWRRGLRIDETDILINISWRVAPRAVLEPEDYCLETLVLHELGHMFGLPHQDREGSLMYPLLEPGRSVLAVDDRMRAEFSRRYY